MFDITDDAGDDVPDNMEDEGFKVNVFCTDLGLTSMPVSLPPDTVYLNLQNNQVNKSTSLNANCLLLSSAKDSPQILKIDSHLFER